MALGMMLPGMFSGWLQNLIGYQHFFVWVFLAAVPSLFITKLIKVDENFGKKILENDK
jgi:PAT family beta-lactamase induction signal transducer AmpG